MNEKQDLIFPKIILLSGTPATGKTTIAKQLKNDFGWIFFSLGDFIVNNNLYIKEDIERNTKLINTELASIKGFIEVLKQGLIQKDINKKPVVIVDSHYADIIIDGLIEFNENRDEILKENDLSIEPQVLFKKLSEYIEGIDIIGIIIRCKPQILEKRLKKRSYSENKIMENIQAEILSESINNMIEVIDKKSIFEIDNTEISIENIVKKIYDIVCNTEEYIGEYTVGKINWMRKLEEEGILNNYFKEDLGFKRDINYDYNESNKEITFIEEEKRIEDDKSKEDE
ncbi:MAG: AAA family ATPase [archaeon]|nr:AAA family ATPase [archaeon]